MTKSFKRRKINLIKGGGCTAPDVVSRYISPPCSGMPAQQSGYQNIFERVFYSPPKAPTNLTPSCNQSGGGWFFDFSDPVGKQPTVQKYEDCCPPVLLNKEVHMAPGTEPQCGGKRKSQRKLKKKMSKKTHHKSKSKKPSALNKNKNNKNLNKKKNQSAGSLKHGKKSKKTLKKSVKPRKTSYKKKKQSGGQNIDFQPQQSHFSADMNTREFGCRQPDWNPKCI